MQKINYCREIEKCILDDNVPSGRLSVFAQQPWFCSYPYSMLLKQIDTEQSPLYHPEGNVWNHTLLVVDEAALRKQYSTDPRVFMWAALLHDIGKPTTTRIKKGRITAYNHDREGGKLASSFLSALTDEADFVNKVMWLVHYHMQVLYVIKDLPFKDISGMRERVSIYDVALLGYCDRLGRTGANTVVERNNVSVFLEKCNERINAPWLRQE